ncbi:MAG: glycosyltransferase family 9 protein [Verrucomicrobiota bacterium]
MAVVRSLKIDFDALESILIVKPSSLGDIVHTLPLLSILRQAAPQAKIDWLVNAVWSPLLEGQQLLDGLVEYPRQEFRGAGGPIRFGRWARKQRERRPDLALDVQGLLRSAVAARACKSRRIVGYSDAREGANLLHHDVVDVSLKRSPHAVDRYLTFCQATGLEIPDSLDFQLPAGDSVDCDLPESFILLHPFSRGKGKSLTNSQVQALVAAWGDRPVVVVGKADGAGLQLPDNALNLLNQTTIAQLIWLLRQASFVVSVDSGPMHLAAAATGNLLSIHTWTDPLKVGPYRPEAWVWNGGEIHQMSEHREDPQLRNSDVESFEDNAIQPLADFVAIQFDQ